jgi:RES domain
LSSARGSGRLRVVQSPPDADADLRRFPRRTLRAGMVLFRVARHAPWWYCSDRRCRFDLDRPDGTCYLAHDEVGALLELIGPELAGGAVSEEFIAGRRIHRLVLDADVVLADTASRRATGFGVTNELATTADYATPQAWAAALHAHHFAGIAYRLRFDPGTAAGGVALFGTTGQHDSPADAGRAVEEADSRRLQRECGITLVPRPRLDQLVIDDNDDDDGPGNR